MGDRKQPTGAFEAARQAAEDVATVLKQGALSPNQDALLETWKELDEPDRAALITHFEDKATAPQRDFRSATSLTAKQRSANTRVYGQIVDRLKSFDI